MQKHANKPRDDVNDRPFKVTLAVVLLYVVLQTLFNIWQSVHATHSLDSPTTQRP